MVGLTVQGSTAEAFSNRMEVEFDNTDGVHLTAVAPGNSELDSGGNVWYGGPGTTLEITALPVLYSGGSASAVTLLGFCGAGATSDEEAPFVFTPDCAKAGQTSSVAGESPRFTLTVGGASIAVGEDDVLNGDDDIFPIRLDYQGPDAPHFFENPNNREDGWVNASVDFVGENGTGSKKNGWLVYNERRCLRWCRRVHAPAEVRLGGFG